MSGITQISTHVVDAVARLLIQYRGKTNIEGLVQAFVTPTQAIENTIFQLLTQRMLPNAVGAQLDMVGKLIGVSRIPGQSDTDYIHSIQIGIIENNSTADPETIISLFKLLTSASQIFLSDNYYGSIGIMSELNLTQTQINLLFPQIKTALGAGIRIEYIGHFDVMNPFAFDGPSVGGGFGTTTDGTIGGKFATISVYTGAKFAFAGIDFSCDGFGTTKDAYIGGVFVGL